MSAIIYAILLCIWLVSQLPGPAAGGNPVPAPPELILNRTLEWKNLSTHFINFHHRNSTKRNIEASMNAVLGVYNMQSTSVHKGHPALDEVLLMTVIEFDSANSAKFKNLFLNWVCYIKEFNLKVLVYIIGKDCLGPGLEETITSLRADVNYPHLHFVSYPYGLFWHALSFKQGGSLTDMYLASPKVECANFKVFGSLMTTVAIFEVILHGHSVLYLDIDLVLIRDPIPYMLQGSSDINVGIESRDCSYSSRTPPGYNHWAKTEPNTGVMFIRNSVNTKIFVRRWLRSIIDGSHRNDQLALLNIIGQEKMDESCNPKVPIRDDMIEIPLYNSTVQNLLGGLSHYSTSPLHHKKRHHHNHHFRHSIEKRVYDNRLFEEHDHFARNETMESNRRIKFCFLNEFIFPNGMIGLHCSLGKKGGHIHDYMLGVKSMGSIWTHNNAEVISSVIVHSNYVGNKERSLSDRGLWLQRTPDNLNNFSYCNRIDLDKISFTQPDYLKLFDESQRLYNSSIAKLVNGTVFRYEHDKTWTFHVYFNNTRRQIENKDLYFKLGLNDSIVSSLTDYVLYAIPKAPGIYKEDDMRSALAKYSHLMRPRITR